ncbi:MAG: carboxypeptidase-like regulatory domain-containing protein [Methanomicrobiales archaeon]
MKKQILLTTSILILTFCLIGAVSAADDADTILPDSSPETLTEDDVTISGIVEKCSTGEPFNGATITIATEDESKNTTTDSEGKYSINIKTSTSNLQVTATAPGHNPAVQNIALTSGANIYTATSSWEWTMYTYPPQEATPPETGHQETPTKP